MLKRGERHGQAGLPAGLAEHCKDSRLHRRILFSSKASGELFAAVGLRQLCSPQSREVSHAAIIPYKKWHEIIERIRPEHVCKNIDCHGGPECRPPRRVGKRLTADRNLFGVAPGRRKRAQEEASDIVGDARTRGRRWSRRNERHERGVGNGRGQLVARVFDRHEWIIDDHGLKSVEILTERSRLLLDDGRIEEGVLGVDHRHERPDVPGELGLAAEPAEHAVEAFLVAVPLEDRPGRPGASREHLVVELLLFGDENERIGEAHDRVLVPDVEA